MIAVESVSKSFGAKRALDRVSLSPAPGATTVLIGPSGCGKSTLLRLMAGLVAPDSGRVLFDSRPLGRDNLMAARRRLGYVIQDGGLFPHLDARDNVTLAACHPGRDRAWIDARVAALSRLVRIGPDVLERYPVQLSGGERHRIALMRALLPDPELLLLDEPLAALDPTTRGQLQAELKGIFEAVRRTVVLVTHDLHEAAWLGDYIALMRDGRIVQQGTLEDLLARPAEPFVSEFIRAQRADPRLARA
jgi:osmoprotectant transport system ATP-binding protein